MEQSRAVELLNRQPHQRGHLQGERGTDGDRAASDHPIVVEQVGGGDQIIQLCQRGDRGDRDEMAPSEAADLALHAALLMRPVDARAAKERVKPVVAAQRVNDVRQF